MAKFRKRPVVIEAHRWWTSGDHPKDDREVFVANGREFLGEGKIVRYYRHPDVPGDRPCHLCGHTMHNHGWIDTLEHGHNVCPGDWIITGVKGEHYPCKPDIFAATYDQVPGEAEKVA